MILIVLTVVVIALFIAVLAIFLFRIGLLLNRTADDLDDCSQNVKNIAYQTKAIGPGVVRINETGTTVLGALPLLCNGAESVAVAKGAPYADPSDPSTVPPVAAPSRVPSTVPPRGSGYLDTPDTPPRGLGYMDA
ncbi:MAG: hypothetical protein ACRDTA_00870 [Pseudonocardiaceae bacterium]